MKHFLARFDRGSMMRTQGERRCNIVQSPASWVTEQRVGHELADTWLCNENTREGNAVVAKAATVYKVWTSSNHASLLTEICVQTGTFANVETWQGWYSPHIGNSKLVTSENKSTDPF